MANVDHLTASFGSRLYEFCYSIENCGEVRPVRRFPAAGFFRKRSQRRARFRSVESPFRPSDLPNCRLQDKRIQDERILEKRIRETSGSGN